MLDRLSVSEDGEVVVFVFEKSKAIADELQFSLDGFGVAFHDVRASRTRLSYSSMWGFMSRYFERAEVSKSMRVSSS